MDHLNKEKVRYISDKLFDYKKILQGIGALMSQQIDSPCYDETEIHGLGQLFNYLARELEGLEDILNCGHDSVKREEIDRLTRPRKKKKKKGDR